MDKLPFRYENLDSLNGTWSVNSRNGEAFEDFRIKFNKDLTYDFYTQDVNGDWILSESNEGKFINYKKFIVINSNDNAYLGRVEKKHSSLWNIVEASPYKGSLELNDGKGVSYTFIYLSDKNGDI